MPVLMGSIHGLLLAMLKGGLSVLGSAALCCALLCRTDRFQHSTMKSTQHAHLCPYDIVYWLQVDTVIGDDIPTLEQVKAMPYTTRVISEAMRLYPQPPVLIRRALQEDTLAGYTVAPGSDLFISVWNLHRYLLALLCLHVVRSLNIDLAKAWMRLALVLLGLVQIM